MGVGLRRRYGFQHGRLTAFEDEDLTAPAGRRSTPRSSRQEIERPRVGPMRDIVATIQPEQDVIVRSDLSQSVCVQGAPGTGKTAVGLHRAAYLLYAHREQLTRQGVLVVGPERQLPALHPRRAAGARRDRRDAVHDRGARRQARCARSNPRWTRARRRRRRRGHAQGRRPARRGAAPRAVVARRRRRPRGWSCRAARGAGGSRRTRSRSSSPSLRARGVRYGAARAMVPQSLAHRVLVRMELAGDSPDDRVQNAVARSKPVKDYAAALWPAVDPARLVWRLLSDAGVPRRAPPRACSTPDEQALLLWAKPPKSPASTPWTLAEAVLVDEAADLVERTAVGRPHRGRRGAGPLPDDAAGAGPALLHRVADRARRPRPGHHAVGDPVLGGGARPPRQARRARRAADPRLPGARRGDRVRRPAAAARSPPTSSRRRRCGGPAASCGIVADRRRSTAAGGRASLPRREGSVGRDRPRRAGRRPSPPTCARPGSGSRVLGDEPRRRRRATSRPSSTSTSTWCRLAWPRAWSSTTSCCVEPAAIVAGEPDRVTGLRRLYVCLTRAVTSLAVHHAEPLPAELGDPERPVSRAPLAPAPGSAACRGPRRSGPRPLLAAARADVARPRSLAAYADQTRGYHDLRHLRRGLRPARGAGGRGAAYDRDAGAAGRVVPRRGLRRASADAEERSAAWAEDALTAAGVPAAVVAEVARLVRLTETHRPEPDDADGPRSLRRRPRDPGRDRRPLRGVRRRRAARVRPRRRRRLPRAAGRRCCATCSPSRTCSTRRTRREHWEAAARGPTSSASSRRCCSPGAAPSGAAPPGRRAVGYSASARRAPLRRRSPARDQPRAPARGR